MSLRHLVQDLAFSLIVPSLVPGFAAPATRAQQSPPACTANQVEATSAELQGATGALAGRIYFTGRR